ncbi:hypothetical protein MR988_03690 [bacterium]|nr:hypothetical protein [bacterium]
MDKAKEKSNKKPLIIIIAILVIAALAVGGVVVYNGFFAEKPTPSNGVVGKISDGWDTGLEDETAPKKTGIQIPGYGTAVMKSGDESLSLSIGNPKENKCGFYATLKLEDGTVLYESELLKPGYGLTEVPLNQTLEAGEYTAMVVYKCVTLDEEHTPLNSAESEFKLIVSD